MGIHEQSIFSHRPPTGRHVPVPARQLQTVGPAWTRLALLALLALLLWAAVPGAHAAAPGLVAEYGFDLAGAPGSDTSGNNLLATCAGTTCPAWQATGGHGASGAYDFAGAGNYLVLDNESAFDFTTQFSVTLWMKIGAFQNEWEQLIGKGDSAWAIERQYTTNRISFTTFGPTADNMVSTTDVTDGLWHHVAVVYNGQTKTLYIDGAVNAQKSYTRTLSTNNRSVRLGSNEEYPIGNYSGLLDDVRIYQRALTATEVQNDMNTPVGTTQTDTQAPTVALSAPAAGATLSGTVTLAAQASDNVGVAAVRFLVDGAQVGEDQTAPFSYDWNSSSVVNGAHVLTAEARDAAGNKTLSAPVSVSTANTSNPFYNEVWVDNLNFPTTIEFLPDGRMLIGDLTEVIYVVPAGARQPNATPFLSLDNTYTFGEQGLMDIMLDPNFTQNGYYYVFYTKGYTGSHNRDRLSRFTASGNTTVAGSEVVIWEDTTDSNTEHHGGAINFGPDGKIYVTVGDHFTASTAQRLDSPHGKILRLNPDGSIPTDNPFYDGAGSNVDSIWALGLRNPYRARFDTVTGRYFICEVGGNDPATAWEELNLGQRGANYGWPLFEGAGNRAGYTDPIYTYPHAGRDACIAGGFVYRGSQFPAMYQGSFFFGDYAQRWIKRLTFDAGGLNVAQVLPFEPPDGATDGPYGDICDLAEGPDGALYYVDFGFDNQFNINAATIRRIRYVGANQPPKVVASANPTSGTRPLSVTFSSAGTADPEGQALTYLWNFGDGTTSTAANPTHSYTQNGSFQAVLSVSDGVNTAAAPALTITVGSPPVAQITTPTSGTLFRAGDVINFSGTATDGSGAALPLSGYSWTVVFHHDTHIHPTLGPLTGVASGSFTIPTSGHDFEGNTWYEISLTATDTNGLSVTKSVNIYPRKVNITIDTVPTGLNIALDGIMTATPRVKDTLEGFSHTIEAPNQTFNGVDYQFQSWSDGGAQSHSIIVPATAASFVATFKNAVAVPYKVQTNTVTVTNALNVTIESVPVEHSYVVLSVRGAGPAPDSLLVTGRLINSTTLRLMNSSTTVSARVQWQVITAPVLTVQQGEVAFAADATTVSVTLPAAVTTAQSFILANQRLSSNVSTDFPKGAWTARFANSTSLFFQRAASGAAGAIAWQVVQWPTTAP